MRVLSFAVAFVLLFAGAAQAIDTNKYPHTLIDQTCTDSFNVPAAYTPNATSFDGSTPVSSAALVQLSGTGDGFCDNDSRILTGAITADTRFGPFRLVDGERGIYLFVDRDTVTGGTINFHIQTKIPHNGAFKELALSSADASTGAIYIQYGGASTEVSTQAEEAERLLFPREYYVFYNEITATTVTLEMSQVPFY